MPLSINIRVLETRGIARPELHDLRKGQLRLQIEIDACARHDAYAEPQPMRLRGRECHSAAEPPAVRRHVADGMADHDEIRWLRTIRECGHLRGEIETWRASPSPTLAVETLRSSA